MFNKLLIHSNKEIGFVDKMVEIRSPVKLKDLEGKLGVLFKALSARA